MEATYSVYEAKTRLSEILRRVKDHRPVVITERGRKVAMVIPYEAGGAQTLEERILSLERRGLLRQAKRSPREGLSTLPGARAGALRRFLAERE